MRFIKHFILRLAITVFVLAVPLSAGTGAPFAGQMVQGISDPRSITGLEAWYDVSDLSSIVKDGSNRVQLLADKSGNSAENVLALNGAVSNSATVPHYAALNTTDVRVRALIAPDAWLPSAGQVIFQRDQDASVARCWSFALLNTGVLRLSWFPTGASASQISIDSTAAPIAANYSSLWIEADLDVDDGSGKYTVTFRTSPDGVTWTQLGAVVNGGATTNLFSGAVGMIAGISRANTSPFAGRIQRLQVFDGASTTAVFDANFTAQSKLATSFTESSSNAATVTINTTGRYGARICGARDLVNMTAAEQPIYSVGADGRALLTFDGTDDSLKAAAFALAQPEWVNFVGSQVSWSSGDYVIDGNTANSMAIAQTTSTPRISMSAGSLVAENSGWSLGSRNLVQAIFNGASSSLTVGQGTPTTGSVGVTSGNGLLIGSLGGTTNYGNITLNEVAIYSFAPTDAQKTAWYLYALRKWAF
jgi:hypothetical protein